MTKFKQFKLGELFEIKLSDGDNKLSELPKGSIPLISSGLENSGVVGYVNSNTELFPAKSITLDMFGNAYFQNKNFVTVSHGRVNILIWKCDYTMLNNFAALYVTSVINKATGNKYSYSSMLSSKLARELIIQLPVKDLADEEPDWDYMEQVIKQTEAPMMNELDQWLQTKDPVLSDNEVQSILDRYQKADFKDFRIGDLFEINTGTRIEPEQLRNGVTKRVTVKNSDNGIYGSFDTDSLNANTFENFVSINFFGNAYYHSYRATLEMKVHCLKLKDHEYNNNLGLYIVSALNKRFNDRFGYGNQLSSSKLKNESYFIKLPVTKNNEPDYQLMENYIKVIQQKYVRNLETKLQNRIQVAKTLI